jgi:magnesium-transporting ATPase (P-type)
MQMQDGKFSLKALAHLNNFIFLVFAFCTHKIYNSKSNDCVDSDHEFFLNWMFLGNSIIYVLMVFGMVILKIPFLERILTSCGAVVITI